jgi:hypothetical protein
MFECIAPNRTPSVTLNGCTECEAPCAVKLRAQASDPDDDLLSYSWSGCASGSGATAVCSVVAEGSATATVTVDDGRGGTASATAEVVGRAPNQAPLVSISGPTSCHPTPSSPCEVTLIASASDPDGDPLSYIWSGCASGTSATASCTVSSLSEVEAVVHVSDGRGGEANASHMASGVNAPPTCSIGQAMFCAQPLCRITFGVNASDPDGDTPIALNCADGTALAGNRCRFDGAVSGTNTVKTINVKDAWGETGACSVRLKWHGACSRCD